MNPGKTTDNSQPRRTVFIPEPRAETKSLDVLREVAEVKLGDSLRKYTENELLEQARDVDALIISSRDAISRRIIEGCPKLKIISKRGAKPSNVDIEAATERGIPVTWTPGSNAVSVAEHALMMILAQIKRLIQGMNGQKDGKWRGDLVPGNELSGKTVGIIGLGQAGSELAKRLACFGVRIVAYDPYVPRERAEQLNVEMLGLEELLKVSDIVTLHCDLTQETRHLIGEEQLKQMRKSAYIVNTARGGLIDTRALYDALKEGLIAGAALDVFEEEPTGRDNPLFSLDNALHTPHMAGITHESVGREPVWAAEEVVRVLKGEPPKNVVNPEYTRNVRTK
jgi:D-3-phosphoglycerate dehydrogenase